MVLFWGDNLSAQTELNAEAIHTTILLHPYKTDRRPDNAIVIESRNIRPDHVSVCR